MVLCVIVHSLCSGCRTASTRDAPTAREKERQHRGTWSCPDQVEYWHIPSFDFFKPFYHNQQIKIILNVKPGVPFLNLLPSISWGPVEVENAPRLSSQLWSKPVTFPSQVLNPTQRIFHVVHKSWQRQDAHITAGSPQCKPDPFRKCLPVSPSASQCRQWSLLWWEWAPSAHPLE